MTDNRPDATVTDLPKRKRFNFNKTKVAKIGAATGGALLGILWLKKKLNADVDGKVNVTVKTADETDN